MNKARGLSGMAVYSVHLVPRWRQATFCPFSDYMSSRFNFFFCLLRTLPFSRVNEPDGNGQLLFREEDTNNVSSTNNAMRIDHIRRVRWAV